MAESTTPQQPTEANLSEKSAPAQVHNTAPYNRYTLQPAQFQPLDAPKPEPFRPRKSFSMGKLILGCANFVFAIIVLGLSIGILTVELYDIVVVIIAGVMAIISILWQIADFVTIAVRKSIHRPIHPGAHVGMHLILWVLALLVTISFCFTLSYELTSWTVDAQCGSDGSGYYNTPINSEDYDYCSYYTFPSDAKARLYLGMLEAVTAFSLLMLLCHFALFVMACVETDRRRKWNKQARVVYLVAASGPADGRTYYTQVPRPQQQQQQQMQMQQEQQQPAGQQRTMGPSQEMYGYFAPPAPSAAAAAPPHSKPERGQADSQEVTVGPSIASHA